MKRLGMLLLIAVLTLAGSAAAQENGEPLPFNETIRAQLEAFIGAQLEAFGIPGAAVAVVQDGQVVYLQGFGQRDEAGAPVTPQTQMMIGSTTKTFTTLLMATLVDEGLVGWDTRVVEIWPDFALADAALTPQITFANLVCHCTGVPRRDLNTLFNTFTPEQVIASVAEFELAAEFGTTFQYSNQMISTAGYLAGVVAGGDPQDLAAGYRDALQTRVLDPLGMTRSTLDYDVVLADADHAQPFTLDLTGIYVPMSTAIARGVLPEPPAGGLWSTAEDMARYLLMELNRGIAPDGTRIVSEDNLTQTWTAQVPITADLSYGLGWFVDIYQGLPLLQHGGNTIGFTSDFAFLPEQGIGVVVLTNAGGSTTLNAGVRTRVFELLLGQPDATTEALAAAAARIEDASDQLELVSFDPTTADTYAGTYTSAALGEITLVVEDNLLVMDAGEFRTRLIPLMQQADPQQPVVVMADPPLVGLTLRLRHNDAREPEVVLAPRGAAEEVFTRLP